MERGAFGSGEHETTRSCLEFLEQVALTGATRILDFGSGTGILSIAALKLGAAESWCVDIDEKAIRNSRNNCRINGVAPYVHHFCGPLDRFDESGFDLLLANIYGDLLLAYAEPLVAKLRPRSTLILSGILWEDNYDVRRAYQDLGCQVIRNRFMEDYSSVLMKKG